MSNKKGFEALNNSLKDIKITKSGMGGDIVLLAGNFCQTLLIEKN